MEIIRKKEDNIEFYSIALTGQSGMSQSGLAILAGVSQQALSQLEKTLTSRAPSESLQPFVAKDLTLTIENPSIDGKSVGNLKIYKSSYCAAVLKHYASKEDNENRQIPLFTLLKFAENGINAWIQDITGWRSYQESFQPHTDVYHKRIQHMRDHKVDDDLWMIFREAAELLLLVEKDWRVPINDYDILDGSIGKRWSNYRCDKNWAGVIRSYIHEYRDQRGSRPCNAFSLEELPYFRKWLREEYIPKYLPEYLINKYGKLAVRQIYTEIGNLTNYILEITHIQRITPKQEKVYQNFLMSRQKLLGGN